MSLLAKAAALGKCVPVLDDADGNNATKAKSSNETTESFCTAVAELKQWVDSADALKEESDKDALALTLMRYELARSRPGAALAVVRERLSKLKPDAKGAKELATEAIKLYRSLELEAWAVNAEETQFARFPVVKLPL